MLVLSSLVLLLGAVAPALALSPDDTRLVSLLGAQGINLLKLRAHASAHTRRDQVPLAAPSSAHAEFKPHWFKQPVDHFKNDSGTWQQRYWINTRHYKHGSHAPVIVIDGGETSGENRLPFLDTGIADILPKATGGIGVILEHRYYGESLPVSNFTTDSLRFLNNDQSAADSARFMAHVKFPGVDEDITAPKHPWIYYGGSYAGARAAHMKILYPELVYGAIASSAVTHASLENWEYMEIIRDAADWQCSEHLENAIKAVDAILTRGDDPASRTLKDWLKGLFGLKDLEHDEDFASVIESPLSSWQAKNWDPAIGSTRFDEFCEFLNKPVLGSEVNSFLASNESAEYDPTTETVTFGNGMQVDFSLLNYAKWIKENYVSLCPVDAGATIEQCFGTYDDSAYSGTSLEDTWRLWLFQVCTEWGYFFSAPPEGYPRIVSSLLTLPYESKICKQAYKPGAHFVVPPLPNVTAVNALGDFAIAADRLAFIDGDVDPWKPCTPHSMYAAPREDTVLRPFKLIPDGVHHYDENGLRNPKDEPPHIQRIHREIVGFVEAWLKDWTPPKKVD
ncbi:peptidase S28 [Phanerochaete sordida]|uniref:Peptidase S28 n=1 Tax=Phanerochaete sordida TaxID=48140 RepID=A0A9P3GTA1_9APHY|nr:peptidase S28 [Phanerochaete sordida]